MSTARIFLIITALGSIGYAIGLLIVPDLLADLQAGPPQTAWVRYLIPIYIGLGLVAWEAWRDPVRMSLVGWSLVVVWAGLAVAHVVNMTLGDEPVEASTVGLLAFDTAMAVGLTVGLLKVRSPDAEPSAQ